MADMESSWLRSSSSFKSLLVLAVGDEVSEPGDSAELFVVEVGCSTSAALGFDWDGGRADDISRARPISKVEKSVLGETLATFRGGMTTSGSAPSRGEHGARRSGVTSSSRGRLLHRRIKTE